MVKGRVSVIVPTRGEQFNIEGKFYDCVGDTILDIAKHAEGDVELIAVLDGYWPNPALPDLPNLVTLHKGTNEGMRPAINDGARVATGEFLLKMDGHCSIDQGWDTTLKTNYHENNWVMVPRRDRLDPDTWGVQYTGKPPVDYHYLSYPFERPGDSSCGMHGTIWNQRIKERKNKPEFDIDDEMSSQGSCWFMSKEHWDKRLIELDVSKYGNFIQEFQEIGLKTWLGGGAVKINKKLTYLHLHKGPKFGRGYFISKEAMRRGSEFAIDYWMNDRWEGRVHNLKWLIEKFSPVPTWPADLSLVPGWV